MRKLFKEESLLNAESFTRAVFDRHHLWMSCLFGMAKKHQRHLIDDVLQEFYAAVFLKWAIIPKEPHARVTSFLYIMLRSKFINALRRERRPLNVEDLLPAEHPSGLLYHLCFDALLEEQSRYLAGLLPETDFEILKLKMQGFLSKEIAKMLKVKTNYVDVRLHRIRKQLRSHFSSKEL